MARQWRSRTRRRPVRRVSFRHWAAPRGRSAAASEGVQPAGAVVEARLVFRKFPRAGELIEVHSGITEIAEKTLRIVHWIIDPETGAAWASMEAVALTFDVNTRKALTPGAEARERIAQLIVLGLQV